MRKLVACGSVFVFIFLALSLRATEIFDTHFFDEPGGVSVQLQSLANQPPLRGFLSTWISIKNHTLQELKWTIKSSSTAAASSSLIPDFGCIRSVRTILVPPNEERNLELLIPVATSPFDSKVVFSLEGPGIFPEPSVFSTSRKRSIKRPLRSFPQIAFDASLLKNNAFSHLDLPRITVLNPTLLSRDWRAYSGFGNMVLAAPTWIQMGSTQRNALKNWCSLGGSLILIVPADFGADVLPSAGPYGFGQIFLASNKEFMARFLPNFQSTQADWNLNMPQGGKRHPGREEKKHSSRNIFWVAFFGVAFAVLVGPVNLWILAPPLKRNRILWTTPLVAVGVSTMFFLCIIIQQGIGGQGSRTLLAFQLPEESFAAIWQEQTSYTGLLVRNTFQTALPLLLLPSAGYFPESSYTLIDGNQWSGDWFLPSSVQSQVLATVRPASHKIFLFPGKESAPPRFVEKPDSNINTLFYIRPDGSVWWWNKVDKTFVASSFQNLEKWFNEVEHELGPLLRERLAQVRKRLVTFPNWKTGLAFAKWNNLTAIPTLSSIRWTDTPAVLIIAPTVPITNQ